MTNIVPRTSTRRWLGSLLGLLAGLWGVTVILIFAVSQARMIAPETPLEIVLGSDGGTFLMLGLQLVGYVVCGTIALLAGLHKIRNIHWLRLMLLLSLAFLGLSVIPFSTLGAFNLPAAAGALASSFLLMAAAGDHAAMPAARDAKARHDP
jgi:hypothetical protein